MHWRRHDYRIESLKCTINGLSHSISQLESQGEECSVYAETFFSEEVEPIYGLAIVALQQYINSSIFDLYETLKNKEKQYKQSDKYSNSGRTKIELIIGIANYFKHRDDIGLNKGTAKILEDFKMNLDDLSENYYSPIFLGLEILTPNNRIEDLIAIVQEWREKLWVNEEKTTQNKS